MEMTNQGVSYAPLLKAYRPRVIPFDEWWNEPIIVDVERNHISRRDMILAVANKDGGAHVDTHLDGVYYALAKLNSMGWIAHVNGVQSDLEHAEKVTLRHIAFEVVEKVERDFLPVLGKQGCWCGSGRAARYCHLKEMIARSGEAGINPKMPDEIRKMPPLPNP